MLSGAETFIWGHITPHEKSKTEMAASVQEKTNQNTQDVKNELDLCEGGSFSAASSTMTFS